MRHTGDISETAVDDDDDAIELPASTAGPFVAAFGLALMFGGLATHVIVFAAGALLAIGGGVDWFCQVLPHAAHERVEPVEAPGLPTTTRRDVETVDVRRGLVRANLPIEFYPVSAGVRGGIAGAVAMAACAVVYGIVSRHGVFYPINLLVAGFFPAATAAHLSTFHAGAFALAVVIHGVASVLVGVLYGALLPLLPRHPIWLGGLIGPFVWTGLLHSTLALINPVLAERIDWFWFAISQIAFGVVAGLVVSHRQRVATAQPLPWQVRAGMEATGLSDEARKKNEDKDV